LPVERRCRRAVLVAESAHHGTLWPIASISG
jgi:hypothetical protein